MSAAIESPSTHPIASTSRLKKRSIQSGSATPASLCATIATTDQMMAAPRKNVCARLFGMRP